MPLNPYNIKRLTRAEAAVRSAVWAYIEDNGSADLAKQACADLMDVVQDIDDFQRTGLTYRERQAQSMKAPE